MKKILSVLLALVMVLSMIPVIASAAEVSETIALAGSVGTVSGESISWTSGSLSFTANKNKSSNAIRTDDTDHFRLYVGFSATLTCSAGNITKIVMTATGSSYAVAPTGSDGSVGTVSGTTITIVPKEASNTYTIPEISKQTRIKTITVTYATVDSSECTHTNTETIEAVPATCTTAGNTAGEKCADCGEILSGNETIEALGHTNDEGVVTAPTCTEDGYTKYTCTVCGSTKKDNYVDATGHNYVDGTCADCGVEKPAGLDGKYYIAAIYSAAGSTYQYMTNDLGTASTKRYQIVDSSLTTLPASIETVVDAQVFELIASGNGYKIKTGDQYLGWTSGNSGTLVNEASAIVATIENGSKAGSYQIHFAASDAERYLSLNSNAANAYYAWYKPGQIQDLYLIPVVENTTEPEEPTDPTEPTEPTEPETPACEHAHTTNETVDATCTEDGYEKTICTDCGEVLDTEVMGATGHSFENGTCSECGAADPNAPATPNAQWILVTDASSLAVGDQIVIVASGNNFALSTTQNNNNRGQVGITKDGNVVEINDSVQILTLTAGTVSNTFGFNTGSGYLYAASSSSNHLKTQTNNNDNGSWLITIDDNGVADIIAQGTSTRKWMQYNESSSLFSCYATDKPQKDISVYKYTTVSGCVHKVADDTWNIVSNATCETAGSQTGTCSKCGETVEKEIPALGHAYSYNTETGKMVCANCGDSFLNTIAEAKAYTDAAKVYYIKGIVTYVSGQTVYMQDATGGICVYFTDAENASGIAVGDELLVWDSMTNYKGLIETTYTKSTEIQVLSSGNELPVQTVTIADLLADTTNEYLGERVQIVGATIGMINTFGNTSLTVGESSINLYKVSGLAANVTENDIVTVTAVVSTYNAYQLLVNPGTASSDVVVTTEGIPSDLALSDISAAKAGTEGTFFKVKGIVTFVDGASVYMQDATGGIVARLASGVTAPTIGTEIEAIGAYTTYNGLIQLEGATFTEVSTDNSVDAKEVTLADLLAGAATNALLSEKIALNGLKITKVGTYSADYKNVDYTVTDGTNSFVLYRTPAASADKVLKVGDVINVVGVVTTYNGYQLRIVAESDIVVVPTVELTHISLNPGLDALGYKASATNLPEGATLAIRLWVTEDRIITKSVSKDNIALRLKNILANNGGETVIYAQAVILQGDVVIAQSTVAETTMKDVITTVNGMGDQLDTNQKSAVYGLYAQYVSTIDAWLGDNNNIASWKPTEA